MEAQHIHATDPPVGTTTTALVPAQPQPSPTPPPPYDAPMAMPTSVAVPIVVDAPPMPAPVDVAGQPKVPAALPIATTAPSTVMPSPPQVMPRPPPKPALVVGGAPTTTLAPSAGDMAPADRAPAAPLPVALPTAVAVPQPLPSHTITADADGPIAAASPGVPAVVAISPAAPSVVPAAATPPLVGPAVPSVVPAAATPPLVGPADPGAPTAVPPAALPASSPTATAAVFVPPIVPPLAIAPQAHAAAVPPSPQSLASDTEHTARPSPAPAQAMQQQPIVVPEVRVSTVAGNGGTQHEVQGWQGNGSGGLTPPAPGGLLAIATPRDAVRLSGGTPTPARGPSGSVHSAGTTQRSSRDDGSSTASTAAPTETTMSEYRGRADVNTDAKLAKKSKTQRREQERELAAAAKAARKQAKEEAKHLRAASRAPGGSSPLISHEGPTMWPGPTHGTTARSILPLTGGGLCVTVASMSPLRPSLKNIHPFVRVWLVDARSGLLIQPKPHLVSCHTHPFDLRSRGTVAPSWHEELLFAIPQEVPAEMAQSMCEPTLLFEVLDFGLSNIQGDIATLGGPRIAGGANLLHICWGFYKLRRLHGAPASVGGGPKAKEAPLHLQLFEYPNRRSAAWNVAVACLPSFMANDAANAQPVVYAPPLAPSIQAMASAAAAEGLPMPVPPVYHVFANHNYRKLGYPGGLTVQVKEVDACFFAPKAPDASPIERDLMSLLQECIGPSDPAGTRSLRGDQQLSGSAAFFNVTPTLFRTRAAFSAADVESPHAGLDFMRRRGERVTAPSLVVHEVTVHGAVTAMDFSPNGGCVALATNSAIHAVVEVRETLSPRMHVIGMLRGHLGRINQVKYHSSGQYVVSASSDRTARVWRVGDGPCFVNSSIDEQNICIAVLPMGASCYSATFHADHVVMVGYDTRLLVWHVPQVVLQSGMLHLRGSAAPPLPASSGSLSARRASFHNLYAASTAAAASGGNSDAHVTRIVAVAQNSDTAFFLAVVAQPNEESKLWTLDSAGSFVQWRAAVDDGTPFGTSSSGNAPPLGAPLITSVTMRRRLECPGATSVQVHGLYACLAAQQDRVVYFVDVSTFALLHRIQLASVRGWALVPDGRSVAMGCANGALAAYDVTTGDEISPPDGCPRARVNFGVEHVAWCRGMQLAVVASPLGTAAHGVGEDEASACSTIAVLGRPRREEEVVLDADPKASDFVRATFGGEMRMRRTSAADAPGVATADVPMKRGSRTTPGVAVTAGSHRSRLLVELDDSDRAAVLGRGTDKTSKIDQIMNYWKGLVSKHGGSSVAKQDANSTSAASRGMPPAAST